MEHTKADYYTDVRQLAQQAADRMDRVDSSDTAVRETIDSNYWLIQPSASLELLQLSDNADALFEEEGGLRARHFSDALQQIATAALSRDVHAALRELRPELQLDRAELRRVLDAATLRDANGDEDDSYTAIFVAAVSDLDGTDLGAATLQWPEWAREALRRMTDAHPDAIEELWNQCLASSNRLEL